MPNRPASSALALALALASTAVLAAPASAAPPDPRFELALSAYQPSFDTRVRLDSAEFGEGTDLDFERDLGIEDDATELRAELTIRLAPRFRLAVDRVEFSRSGSNALGRAVQFGDVIYAASAALSSEVESSHTGVALRCSFVRAPAADVAVSVGVSQLEVSARVAGRATATANGFPVGALEVAEEGEASGPVPLGGLHAAFWFGERVRLRLDGRYLDVSELFDDEEWSGSMTEYAVEIHWFVLPWLAVGGGWAGTAIDVDFDDGDLAGSFDYDFDGFRAGVTLAF